MQIELHDSLRAFRSRNYRLFFLGQSVAMTGLWMHRVAIGWLVYRITGSNSALGALDFVSSIPVTLFTAFAGTMIERWDLRKTLMYCQASSIVVAFLFALLVLTDTATFAIIACLSFALGLINAFELPCRYALVSYVVDYKEDFSNAVALNSVNFNIARMIGPTIAGFLIHAVGEGFCFLSNGFAYIVNLFTLKNMKMKKPPIGRTDKRSGSVFREAIKGLRAVHESAPTRYILMLIAFTGFCAFPGIVLMPAMAKSVLHGTSQTLGLLLVGIAIGAIAGAFRMAVLKSTKECTWWFTRTCAAFGLTLIIFSFARNIFFGVLFAIPVGFCMVTCIIACNTLLQSMVPLESKGRIMSLYTLAIVGLSPLGSPVFGKLGDLLGTEWSLFISGICCTISGIYYLKKIDKIKHEIDAALDEQGVH